MATKRTTRRPLTIEYFDRLPRPAREALANSRVIGNGSPVLLIAKAPGDVMAERIARADAALLAGDNTIRHCKSSRDEINAILCGAI